MAAESIESETRRIGCMDFRLVEWNFSMRNAGGGADGFKAAITGAFKDDRSAKHLEIIVHGNKSPKGGCGGLNGVAAIIDGKDLGLSPESTKIFENTFVRFFRGHGFEGASAVDRQGNPTPDAIKKMTLMEEFNRSTQERIAKEILTGIGRGDVQVHARLITGLPTDRHADLVTGVVGSLAKSESEVAELVGSKLGHTYIVRGTEIDEINPSLEIARVVMKKGEFAIVAATKADMAKAEEIKAKPYMEGATVRIVPAFHVKKKLTG